MLDTAGIVVSSVLIFIVLVRAIQFGPNISRGSVSQWTGAMPQVGEMDGIHPHGSIPRRDLDSLVQGIFSARDLE